MYPSSWVHSVSWNDTKTNSKNVTLKKLASVNFALMLMTKLLIMRPHPIRSKLARYVIPFHYFGRYYFERVELGQPFRLWLLDSLNLMLNWEQ